MRQGATFALVPLLILGITQGSSLAGSGSWSLPEESRGSRVAPLLLLSRPEIREDLQIPIDQVAEVEKAIDDLHQKAAALKGKTGEAALAGRKAVDDDQKAWLETHLTPDQVDRLWQVDLRWEGPAAMATRPRIAESLDLSDEQKAALNRAMLERNAHREKTRDFAAADRQFAQRAISILSDGQKLRWERMLGRPIVLKTALAAPSQSAR